MSANKKSDFMKELSCSFRQACLSCSFSDKQLSAFLEFLKRQCQNLPKKYAVAAVGMQPDGSWVLGKDVYINGSGEAIPVEESQHIWIGDIFDGKGVASDSQQCVIQTPLTTLPLRALLEKLQLIMQHNYYPAVLTVASAIMALHYRRFIQKLKSCPVPIIFGGCGGGKTTALRCSLALCGADKRFFREISGPKIAELCSVTDIPLGVDDPDSKSNLNKVIMDLFNGAKRATIGRGEVQPTSTVIISSNFTPIEKQMYYCYCFIHDITVI